MKILAALFAAGLTTWLAAPALADSAPGTTISFMVYPAPVTVAGGPGIVVSHVWSDGALTISAA